MKHVKFLLTVWVAYFKSICKEHFNFVSAWKYTFHNNNIYRRYTKATSGRPALYQIKSTMVMLFGRFQCQVTQVWGSSQDTPSYYGWNRWWPWSWDCAGAEPRWDPLKVLLSVEWITTRERASGGVTRLIVDRGEDKPPGGDLLGVRSKDVAAYDRERLQNLRGYWRPR